LAEPVVFISQQRNAVGDVLNAARIDTLDLRLAVGKKSFEFHSVAHTPAHCIRKATPSFNICMPTAKPKVARSCDYSTNFGAG
jgi:hypothetical protein